MDGIPTKDEVMREINIGRSVVGTMTTTLLFAVPAVISPCRVLFTNKRKGLTGKHKNKHKDEEVQARATDPHASNFSHY